MTTTYLGDISVGQAIPWVATLRAACLALSASINATVSLGLSVLDKLSALINIELLAPIQAELNANLDLVANLQLQAFDPLASVQALISASIEVSANLQAMIPTALPQINLELSAALEVGVELGVKKIAFEAALALIEELRVAITALKAKIDTVLAVLAQINLSLGGVRAWRYSGAALNLVIDGVPVVVSQAFVDPYTSVKAFVLVVDQGNLPTLSALNTLFGA